MYILLQQKKTILKKEPVNVKRTCVIWGARGNCSETTHVHACACMCAHAHKQKAAVAIFSSGNVKRSISQTPFQEGSEQGLCESGTEPFHSLCQVSPEQSPTYAACPVTSVN